MSIIITTTLGILVGIFLACLFLGAAYSLLFYRWGLKDGKVGDHYKLFKGVELVFPFVWIVLFAYNLGRKHAQRSAQN